MKPLQWGMILCNTKSGEIHQLKEIRRKFIEDLMTCSLQFLFFNTVLIKGVSRYTKWDPKNGNKFPALIINCHKHLRNTSGTTSVSTTQEVGDKKNQQFYYWTFLAMQQELSAKQCKKVWKFKKKSRRHGHLIPNIISKMCEMIHIYLIVPYHNSSK